MPTELQNNGNLTIVTNSFVELLTEVEVAIHKGFMLDVDSNVGYPQMIGVLFTVTMFPEGSVEVTEVAGEEHEKALQDALEVDAPKPDGRKKKV
jgi:hypothetical protein